MCNDNHVFVSSSFFSLVFCVHIVISSLNKELMFILPLDKTYSTVVLATLFFCMQQ